MTNLPSSFDVPIPDGASDEEVEALVNTERDQVVDKAIDDDVDDVLKGFDGLK